MKKIKKLKIRLNGRIKSVFKDCKLSELLKLHRIPLKKVANELNQQIIDKNKLSRKIIKKSDKIEIVHFIGGG